MRGAGLALFVLLSACNDPSHPRTLDCPPEQAPCGPTNPPPQGGPPPSDAGSDVTVPIEGGAPVSGRVLVLPEGFDPAVAPLAEPARVEVDAMQGGATRGDVVGGRYTLEGVRVAEAVWAAVIPSTAGDLAATLQPLDTRGFATDGGAVTSDLVVARFSALDLVLGVLTFPVERVPGRAHAVLRFVDEDGVPIPGIDVVPLGDETIAYDSGLGWTDEPVGTGLRGLAVVANVAALALPGSDHTRALGGAASGSVAIRMAQDAVSYDVVVVESGP